MRKRSEHSFIRRGAVLLMTALLGFSSPGGANPPEQQESRMGSLSTPAVSLANPKSDSLNRSLRETSVETDNDESRSIIIGERVPGVLLEDDDTDIYHFWGHCQRKVARTEFSTDDRELGRPELTPLGECGGAVELEIVS